MATAKEARLVRYDAFDIFAVICDSNEAAHGANKKSKKTC